MDKYSMSFDGALLKRGFWLYICDIQDPTERYLYVGRTGDSSSHNAASPFSRLGNHLDFRPNAKANSITKRLKEKEIDPSTAKFEMLAIGPFFSEQSGPEDHNFCRDQMAGLERALAEHLREAGYSVLGVHHSRKEVDTQKLTGVIRIVESKFPPIKQREQEKVKSIPTIYLRKAGVAALENARGLLIEAKLLAENRYWARALCLATIGQEELGKAILFTSAALDLFQDLRKQLSNRDKSNPAFAHELKQLISEYWGIATWEVEEYHEILMDEIGSENWTPTSDVEWLEELFTSISKEDPSCSDILRPREAGKMMKRFGIMNPDYLSTEDVKRKGFYIDLKGDGTISKPTDVGESDTRVAISKLEAGLNDLERLSRVLKNSDDWEQLERRLITAASK